MPSRVPLAALATRLALCAIAVGGIIGGYRLGAWDEGSPGPGLLPLGASAMLLALVMPRLLAASGDAEDAPVERRRLALYVAGLVLFAMLFGPLGLPLAALAALLTVLAGAERMAWLPAAAVALAMTAGVLVLFDYALGVPLPWGPAAGLRVWGP